MEGIQSAQDEPEDELHPLPAKCTVTVALIQSPSVLGDVAANLQRMEKQCRKAAEHGAKILVLPETAITGYMSDDLQINWRVSGRPLAPRFTRELDPTAYAESKDGRSVKHFAALAAELRVYITVPYIEAAGGALYNSVSLVGPTGERVAHYRKNCPWPDPEKSWATPFDNIDDAMYCTEYGWIGMAICFGAHVGMRAGMCGYACRHACARADIHTILRKYHERASRCGRCCTRSHGWAMLTAGLPSYCRGGFAM